MAATSADQDNHLNDSMTSATEEKSLSQPERAAANGSRAQRHAGAWVESLRRSDVSRLWTELQRLVINHPLVRASLNPPRQTRPSAPPTLLLTDYYQ